MQISSILEYNIALSKITAGDTVSVEVYRGTITPESFGSGASFASDVTAFSVVATQYGA